MYREREYLMNQWVQYNAKSKDSRQHYEKRAMLKDLSVVERLKDQIRRAKVVRQSDPFRK